MSSRGFQPTVWSRPKTVWILNGSTNYQRMVTRLVDRFRVGVDNLVWIPFHGLKPKVIHGAPLRGEEPDVLDHRLLAAPMVSSVSNIEPLQKGGLVHLGIITVAYFGQVGGTGI